VFGLVGAGGFAREVMPLVERQFAGDTASGAAFEEIAFVETEPAAETVNGHRVYSVRAFLACDGQAKFFNVAIAASSARQELAERFLEAGVRPMTIQAPTAIHEPSSTLGEGAILCAFTTITANASIGKFFHANLYAYVAHDCEIGDYVTFAPGVCCNGNVRIGDHAYIGTGAILKQGRTGQPLTIGEGAVVGMGAVVTKDVAPYTTVVGNPARVLEKR
jgi:sugar O-acyltransferase (sialic acid O-acetyltransferase NeuD family)